jgi:hypothetical protein
MDHFLTPDDGTLHGHFSAALASVVVDLKVTARGRPWHRPFRPPASTDASTRERVDHLA